MPNKQVISDSISKKNLTIAGIVNGDGDNCKERKKQVDCYLSVKRPD